MKHLLIILFAFSSAILFAQQDTSLLLHEVKIVDYRMENLQQTSRTEIIDTTYISRVGASSLTTLLENHSSVFVKDNGGGRLSTLSIRGTTASQNNVLWNGLALNTPTLGISDLSLMPAFFTEGLSVQYGGNGSLNGDDAIGGAVNIYSIPSFNKGMHFQLMSNTASFGDFEKGIKVSFSDSKISLKSAVYHHSAINDYTIKSENREWKLPHASYYQNGLQQEFAWAGKKDVISFHFMQLDARRETPPLLSSASLESEQVQFDNQIRIVGRWKHENEKIGYIINTGMLNDIIYYKDALTDIDDFSEARSYQLNAEMHYRMKKSVVLVGAHLRYTEARVNSRTILFVNGYPEYHTDNKQGIYISYQFQSKPFFSQLSVRYDPSISGVPLVPSAGLTYRITSTFNIKANAAGIYRNPTLNDLYWKPGGNRNLLPEKGGQGDLFFNFSSKNKLLSSELSAGVFYLDVHDYIQWLPGADNVYRPVNEDRIISRGVELSGHERINLGRIQMKLNGSLQYMRSTKILDVKDFTLLGDEKEDQLRYIPKLQWKLGYSISYKKTTLLLRTGYVGHRYTTEDNEYWLTPYRTSGISLTQELYIKTFQLFVSGSVSNLEDKNYEVIAQRPVAGTAYKLSLMMQF